MKGAANLSLCSAIWEQTLMRLSPAVCAAFIAAALLCQPASASGDRAEASQPLHRAALNKSEVARAKRLETVERLKSAAREGDTLADLDEARVWRRRAAGAGHKGAAIVIARLRGVDE